MSDPHDQELPAPEPVEHPDLGSEQDARERGEDPPIVVGSEPPRRGDRDPDPGWQPYPGRVDNWRGIAKELGGDHQPRRENVYPYLLIRAMSPGDRGARPVWPPTPSWHSPDILLMDATDVGPFDSTRLVVSPVVGRTYRVFVRIWNLGLVPAVGVDVRAWAINPGFFGVGNQDDPYYRQQLIGGAWTELTDRTRPGSVAVVELDAAWTVDPSDIGHHCMLAEVRCPLDPASGLLQSNADRHVGMRNLTVLGGPARTLPLMSRLGELVPRGSTLEITHAGPTALGTLQALTGKTLRTRDGDPIEVVLPDFEAITAGVPMKAARHLLTAFVTDDYTVIADSARLARALTGDRPRQMQRLGAVFQQPGGARRLVEDLGPDQWKRLGMVTAEPLDRALPASLRSLLDVVDELPAGNIAAHLGGSDTALHALDFTLTEPAGRLIGGYTIVVTQADVDG